MEHQIFHQKCTFYEIFVLFVWKWSIRYIINSGYIIWYKKVKVLINIKWNYLRTASPPINLYLKDSAWAIAHNPLVATFSAYNSTECSRKLNRFWTTDVNSRILRPFSPNTFWVLVAIMMISVRVGVTRTSTPEYPSSASSRVKNSFNSALKTPSPTNYKLKEKQIF